ncbi:shikimate kinase [soil metagenome]
MSRSQRATRILLIGMMGSGKSSVGRALAARTGWPFLDNDALVERASGRTARQLLADEGEAALREAESAALDAGLGVEPPSIIGVAGGVLLKPVDRRRVAADGFVVWLRAPAEVLAARAVGAEHRPWLDGDAVAWFRRTLAERGPLYAEVSDLEVDTAASTPSEAAEAIVAALASLPSES